LGAPAHDPRRGGYQELKKDRAHDVANLFIVDGSSLVTTDYIIRMAKSGSIPSPV
jgi:hypothetical protein